MAESLIGTVALVTGASSGIGHAAARELAARGASVVITARRADRLEELAATIVASGGHALTLPADITRRDEAAGVVAATIAQLGRLDTVVNSAGVMFNGPTLARPVDDWEAMVDLNLKGLMYVTKAALPHLLEGAATGPRGVTDLVNISSIAGRIVYEQCPIYCATKFAVNAFTEALRLEFTQRNLRVSVVDPGVTESELFSHLSPQVLIEYDEGFAAVEKLHAEDVAEAIASIVANPRRIAVNEVVIRPTDHK